MFIADNFNKPISITHDNKSFEKQKAYDIIVKNQFSYPIINEYVIKVINGNIDTLSLRILNPQKWFTQYDI